MNVEQLRRVLAELPGDVPVVVDDCQMGWMANAALYLAPAHVDCRVTGNSLRAHHHDGADNCHALLITGLGQTDASIVDISPEIARPEVIDVEAEGGTVQPTSFAIKSHVEQGDYRTRMLTCGPDWRSGKS